MLFQMRPQRNSSPLPIAPTSANNRKHGRLRCEHLPVRFADQPACVLDLSASGMRVTLDRSLDLQPGARVNAVFTSGIGELAVGARVIWSSKRAFRRFEVGAAFLDLSPGDRTILAAIARTASDTKTFYKG